MLVLFSLFLLSPASLRDTADFTAAKFERISRERPAPAYLLASKPESLLRDRIRGYRFRIAQQQYEGGIAMRAPGEVVVRLPRPAARFQALVGVDGNDVGYYSNAGRGNVIASVEASGRVLFRSPALRESLPAVPISVDLAGAREFVLKLEPTGQRGKTYQAEWDQADWADALIRMADGSTLRLSEIPSGPPDHAPSTEPPFSFRYDGRPSRDFLPAWRFEHTSRPLDAQRTEHAATYTDPATGLVARAVAITYSDFPVVEWTLYLRNTASTRSPLLEQIRAADISLERGREGEFVLHHNRGSFNSARDFEPLEDTLAPGTTTNISTTGGRPTDTDLGYFNLEWPGRGLILALGWPGQWSSAFTRDKQSGLRIEAGQETTHFRLEPGEEVRGPLVVVQFWRGERAEAQNVWRRWMMAHSMPLPGGRLPAPQMAGGSNRFTIEMQEANEENQKEILGRIAAKGVRLDCWWMDAGWYAFRDGWWNTGTWDPDPARFPHGFAPISKLAHERGMKVIVWFEPERVTAGSWLWQNHPEWLIGTDKEDRLLYLGNPGARRWLTEHVSRLIAEQGIDVYRQDFNFEPLPRWRFNDTEDRQGISEIRHIEGYLAYFDELRRHFPNLLIDTCASGGRRLDVETLRRAVPLWRSDHPFVPTHMQAQTYGLSLWAPYHGTAVNSLDPYEFRSQMTPAAGLGFDPATQTDGYARFERLSAQWRSVAEFFYADFYPLTPWSLDDSTWMAWQFNRPEKGDALIEVFRRPGSSFETARFRLHGLNPDAWYTVENLDTTTTQRLSGRELMQGGFPVTVESRPGALLLRLSSH